MTGNAKLESGALGPFTIRTLGDVGLYADADSGLALGPGKPLALLIYLALTPGRRISREFLMDLLWADLEPERARNALRQTLFHLRKLLGEDAIPGTAELTLALQVGTDRDRFLDAVERGELDAAVEAYTGPFLPDFGTPGGAAFEHWADLERDRLQTSFLRSAELLVRRRLDESRIKDAQRLARRARDEAPNVESSWRLLLESIIVGRDFVAAAVEAQALEHYAAAEGITLAAATRAAIARARQIIPGAAVAASDFTLVTELTGREREFSLITAAWESARTGHARHLHLTAPSGLGKTRLIVDAVARLRAGGAQVVELRGAPGDRDIPFAFAGDLALALAELPGASGIAPASASTLIGLNPMLSSRLSGAPDNSVGDEALRRRIQALGDLVQSVAYEHAFILVVDDMHWIDASSYRVLEGVFSRCAGASILCLTASRPERSPAGETVTALRLAPLTEQQVGSLVSALGSVPTALPWAREFISGLHAATRGSPLLILETLRLALDENVLQLSGGEWTCSAVPRLASLLREAEALRHRVRALPPEQGWALALLATIGSPLAAAPLAAALGRSSADVALTLASLERHGLVTHTEPGWVPAHDEIAEAIRDTLDPDQRALANRIIGNSLIETAGDDHHRLLRGARHLIAAGDRERIASHFRRFVMLSRVRHDSRPVSQLAAEMLGEHEASSNAGALVKTLPLAWRLGLWSRGRQFAAATAVLLLVGGVGTAAALQSMRSNAWSRLIYADSTQVAYAIAVDPSAFDGSTAPLASSRHKTPFVAGALAFPEMPPTVSPDSRSAAWNEDSGDSTTLDIWMRTPAGTRRLTNQVRDDKVQAWLPDGSAVVGLTNRWTTRDAGNYDIAVFDTATGAARQVTSGPGHDGNPMISPDGTRIAFTRESSDRPVRVCIVAFDGMGVPECRLVAGDPIAFVTGWASLTELVLITDGPAGRPLVRYDWDRDHLVVLRVPHVTTALMSPDRRSVAVAARTDGIRGLRDWVVPIDRPNMARLVDRANSAGAAVRWWEGRADQSLLIDRIEFTDTTRVIQPGVGTRLGIRALTAAAAEVPLHAPVRWSSSDTLVATVDSLGVVRPRTLGTATISASLAGWRSTARVFEVRGAAPLELLDERWDDSWRSRWITFGEPHPVLATGPDGIRGMWNHGDGDYLSFAMLRRALDARQGLGVEVRLSTPLTRDDWQRLGVNLVPGVDTTALQRGDQRKLAVSAGDVAGGCGARYPAAAGLFGRSRIAVNGGGAALVELGRAAPALSSGGWWSLRLQILPDGRCGLALNGRVIWLSPERLALDGAFWLRLGDESLGTTLLHGPLQVWSGVRTDIDWTPLPK